MTQSDFEKQNPNVVAGSAIGSKTEDEIKHEGQKNANIFEALFSDSYNIVSNAISAAESTLSSFTDRADSPKYPADPNVSYLAGGALSIQGTEGKVVISNDNPQKTPGMLRMDGGASKFVSTAYETTIGSPAVKTLTSLIMNPNGSTLPSSSMTPAKTWVQSLVPSFSMTDIITIGILKTIQVGLFTAFSYIKRSKRKVNETVTTKDLGTIIIDNQVLETKVLTNAL